MNKNKLSKLESYRKEAITAAKDFCYGAEVINKIKKAVTYNEICRIMVDARHEHFD